MFGDDVVTALTCWRENRGGMYIGMQSVCNVIQNRAKKHGTSLYQECVKPWQFTSITGKGDPELTLWPLPNDPQWIAAQQIVAKALDGSLVDLTGGATLYYNPTTIAAGDHQMFTMPDGSQVPFPKTWNPAAAKYVTSVAGHLFFLEV